MTRPLAFASQLLILLVAAVSGCDERTPLRDTSPPSHDHEPRHGGVVGMADQIHLEAMAARDGRVRVYLTDYYRQPLPLDGVTGTVTLVAPGGEHTRPMARVDTTTGAAMEASFTALEGEHVTAAFVLDVAGKPTQMEFLLPLDPGGAGTAGLPRSCVAPAARGDRVPRCTLKFAGGVSALAVTPDAKLVIIAGVGQNLSAWDSTSGALARVFAGVPPPAPHTMAPNALAMRPTDGRELVVALEKRLLRFAIPSGELVAEIAAPGGVLRDVAWSPEATALLVMAFYDRAAHVLAAGDGRALRDLVVDAEAAAVAIDARSGTTAVASETGKIALFDPTAGAPAKMLAGSHPRVAALAFAGDRLVSGGGDQRLRVWSWPSGNLLYELDAGGPVSRLAVAPGQRVVASGTFNGVVRLHGLDSRREAATLDWHHGLISGLAWAGDMLISADIEGEVAFWDLHLD